MGVQIGAFESPLLEGFYMPPKVAAILIANGWTKPAEQVLKEAA